MKNKTKSEADVPIKKVQLNTRVPEPLKIAVAELSERTEISSETIVADALARFYGTETPGGNLRKRMYSEAIRQLEAEGKLILFPATPNRRSVHGRCTGTADVITLHDSTGNPINGVPYGLPELPQLPSAFTEAILPLAA